MSGEHEIQRLDVGSRKPPKNDLLLVTRCREKETRGPANFLLHYTRCRERVARAFRATPSRHRVEYHYYVAVSLHRVSIISKKKFQVASILHSAATQSFSATTTRIETTEFTIFTMPKLTCCYILFFALSV